MGQSFSRESRSSNFQFSIPSENNRRIQNAPFGSSHFFCGSPPELHRTIVNSERSRWFGSPRRTFPRRNQRSCESADSHLAIPVRAPMSGHAVDQRGFDHRQLNFTFKLPAELFSNCACCSNDRPQGVRPGDSRFFVIDKNAKESVFKSKPIRICHCWIVPKISKMQIVK